MFFNARFCACFLILCTAFIATPLCGKAQAGGLMPEEKKCGSTIPSGSYKQYCKDIRWGDTSMGAEHSVLLMNCAADKTNYSNRMYACSQVKECNFKLAFINHYPRCE